LAATINAVGARAANSQGCRIQEPMAPTSTMSVAETSGTQTISSAGAIEPPRNMAVSFANDGAPAVARMAPGVG
jgi:hypothetical protein